MAYYTSASSSDLSEKSVDLGKGILRMKKGHWMHCSRRTKKLPVRYVDAFQSDDKQEVEMKDSKFF